MKINVLGTEYELIESNENVDKALLEMAGYCDTSIKVCVVDDMSEECPDSKKDLADYKKQVKRHELIHAFLYESGMDACSWALNEEMVDWMAIQFPKLLKAFTDADCL